VRRCGPALMVRQRSPQVAKKKATVPASRPLSDLKPGESATIIQAPQANERLAEIGFVAGEKVTLVRVAPLGDPVVIQVLDTPVIIRRADLAEVLVD